MPYDLLLLTGETVKSNHPRKQFRTDVRKGLAWIEKTLPEWKEPGNLNAGVLNMADGNKCILGQLGTTLMGVDSGRMSDTSFNKFIRLISKDDKRINYYWTSNHGFVARLDVYYNYYDILTDQWRRELVRYPQFRNNIENSVNIYRKALGRKPIAVPGLKV